MKPFYAIAALALAGCVQQEQAPYVDQAFQHDTADHTHHGGPVVTVSCRRGPWQHYIYFDEPAPRFLDSLRKAGYSPSEAQAIGERACRDLAGTYSDEHLKRVTHEIIHDVGVR